jgi:alkylhydroperoxidase family enzyme
VVVADELFDRVRTHLDERGVVELTATVGAYNLVSRFLVALHLEPADKVDRA